MDRKLDLTRCLVSLCLLGLWACSVQEDRVQQAQLEKLPAVRVVKASTITAIARDDAVVATDKGIPIGCVVRLDVEGNELYIKLGDFIDERDHYPSCLPIRKGYKLQVVRHDMSNSTFYYTWIDHHIVLAWGL